MHIWKKNCPTRIGTVNEVRVEMTRDTGATCVVVKKQIVQEHQFLGKMKCCKYIDGSEHYFPVAMKDVETPCYEGTTEALFIDTPLYVLVVGNIAYVKYPNPKMYRMQCRLDHKPNGVRSHIGR